MTTLLDRIIDSGILTHMTWISHVLIATGASANILLYKRDPKAATGWLGVVWLSPYLGAFLYWIFGINRIKRKGALIHKTQLESHPEYHSYLQSVRGIEAALHPGLNTCLLKITQSPLLAARSIEIFQGGEATYEQMLNDMKQAKRCIYLQTYIFDRGQVAGAFLEVLHQAIHRGLEVRVIVDAIGSRYSFPSIVSQLRKLGIPCRRFLPNLLPWHFSFLNLRNHRKILLIDNRIAYTGGINIRDHHLKELAGDRYAADLHFKFTGPIVSQLFDVFAIDWVFASKQGLTVDPSSFDTCKDGAMIPCRVISDGPDFDFEKIRWAMLAAIHAAGERITICTPYFLPDFGVLSALAVAALKGVKVEILVPEKGNIPLINWAMMPQFRQLIQSGCQIYLSPPPFDHSKAMVIDQSWSLIGSSNWDPRSLRLNFEVNIEVYDNEFAKKISLILDKKLAQSRLLSIEELKSRPIWKNLRDNAARLLGPYL